jgi:N-acetyl-anhydromuramyl-L-alanine amidase AmpD
MKRWHIPMSRIVTHQQIAPNRKNDISPGDAARFKSRLRSALTTASRVCETGLQGKPTDTDY